jgi:hypothetical protein
LTPKTAILAKLQLYMVKIRFPPGKSLKSQTGREVCDIERHPAQAMLAKLGRWIGGAVRDEKIAEPLLFRTAVSAFRRSDILQSGRAEAARFA